FCYLKHECQVAGLDSPERWPAVRHFNFLLRLPVLLYLKEAAINSRLQLPATETECHNLAINVSVRCSLAAFRAINHLWRGARCFAPGRNPPIRVLCTMFAS